MTNFEALYAGVMKFEKGYDPNDQGYPAYCGINKKYWPEWEGWKELDKRKSELKQSAFFPELEPLVKSFYKEFWKPVRVDEIKNFDIAQMLVDMRTQHGKWARIVNAAYTGKSPFDASIPNTFGTAVINWINKNQTEAYRAIAEKRVFYSQNVNLQNEADRKNIVKRANSYLQKAIAFVASNPGTTTAVVFFFLLQC